RQVFGAVVQLVRIPACHAGGRGFESRPLRQQKKPLSFDRGFFHESQYLLILGTLSASQARSFMTWGSIEAHSSSVNRRERVRNALPVLPSSENVPPLPSVTSMMSWVCFQ
ncbi:MAG: hypothetical protein RJB21_527, partial [Pseudomonadota bacterium]